MLNLFIGGPLDGQLHETTKLLAQESTSLPIEEYRWTPQITRGRVSDRPARVWEHAEGVPATSRPVAVISPATEQKEKQVSETDVELGPLENRRRELKLSRKAVADTMGSTISKVYRIERNGSRTTEEETALLTLTLDKLEAAQPTPTPAAKTTDANTTEAASDPTPEADPCTEGETAETETADPTVPAYS